MKRFDEYVSLTTCLYGEAHIRTDLLPNPKMKIDTIEQGIEALQIALPVLQNADYSTLDTLKAPMLEAIATAGKKN